MIPALLALAAVAVVIWPAVVRPSRPDVVSLPTSPAGGNTASPPPVSFVQATAALDVVLGYLRAGNRYGPTEQAAARSLRAATVEAATPAPEARP